MTTHPTTSSTHTSNLYTNIIESLAAILTIADEDPKQNTKTSSLDVIELFNLIKHNTSSSFKTLPLNLYEKDENNQAFLSYVKTECTMSINQHQRKFNHPNQPFSTTTLLNTRVVTPIFQLLTIQTDINAFFDDILQKALNVNFSLQESFNFIVRNNKTLTNP